MSKLRMLRLGCTLAMLVAATGLLAACGSGCDDGHGHLHPHNSSWERGSEWEVTCRCMEDGTVQCDDGSTAATSGGMSEG